MLQKSLQLNSFLWKWHVIAGLITLPFVLLLTVTGTIYLFKQDFENQIYSDIKYVEVTGKQLSLTQQLSRANAHTDGKIAALVLAPEHASEQQHQSTIPATEFHVVGRGRASNALYVNPFTGEITGQVNQRDTLMYKIRKLHGELLLDKPGTLLIELVASWFIVLLITGIYIWWPTGKTKAGGTFSVRRRGHKRTFWRDVHAVFGFWLSIFLLIIIAGGMPWTEVFGSQLKWVQKQTNTGYPSHWRNAKGLSSDLTRVSSEKTNTPEKLDIESVITLTKSYQLEGKITIKLPQKDTGVFTISNRSKWLEDQQVIHIDQYSGAIVKHLTWKDVGILMELRQVFMRLHQGEYGSWNWWFLLGVALLFTISTSAGIFSYLKRKPKSSWGIPPVPNSFKASISIMLIIAALGVLFPLFGGSVLLLLFTHWLYKQKPTSPAKVRQL